MNKKGFTLIELVAVIALLGIIAMIVIPSTNIYIKTTRKKAYELQIKTIEAAAKEWVTKYGADSQVLWYEQTVSAISIKTLRESEFLKDADIKNPMDSKKNIEGCVFVIRSENNGYVYEYKENCSLVDGEQYLYKFIVQDDNDSSGDPSVGDLVCLERECFYIISKNGSTYRMLSRYNLNVGYDLSYNGNSNFVYSSALPTSYSLTHGFFVVPYLTYSLNSNIQSTFNRQDGTKSGLSPSSSLGSGDIVCQAKGVINFYNPKSATDKNGYWSSSDIGLNVYNSKSALYPYIEQYVAFLKSIGNNDTIKGSLITYQELIDLGCSSSGCTGAPSWIIYDSYWTGTAASIDGIYAQTYGVLGIDKGYAAAWIGVRPVISTVGNIYMPS